MAVVQYSTKEKAVEAKIGLEKSPIICGVTVIVNFVSEQRASHFVIQLQQQQQQADGPTSLHDQWLSRAEHSSASGGGLANGSRWDSLGRFPQPHTASSSSTNDRETSGDPAPTMWSNSGFLSGLTSPWSNQPQTESALFPPSSKQEPATMSSSPSLSTYLPNGLF